MFPWVELRSSSPFWTLRLGFRSQDADPRRLRCLASIDTALFRGVARLVLGVLVEFEASLDKQVTRVLRLHGFSNSNVLPNLIWSPCHSTVLEVFRCCHRLLELRFHLLMSHLGSLAGSLRG